MPGFVIFVFVLTFAYVVYFSVMITLDLHSKKDEKKTDEETIDVSSMDSAAWIMKKCRFPWKNIMMVLKVVT